MKTISRMALATFCLAATVILPTGCSSQTPEPAAPPAVSGANPAPAGLPIMENSKPKSTPSKP